MVKDLKKSQLSAQNLIALFQDLLLQEIKKIHMNIHSIHSHRGY